MPRASGREVLEVEIYRGRLAGTCLPHYSWRPLLTAANRWARQNENKPLVQLRLLLGDGREEIVLDPTSTSLRQLDSARAAANRPRALAALAGVTKLEAVVPWRFTDVFGLPTNQASGTTADCCCVLFSQLLEWCPRLKAQHCIMRTGTYTFTSQIARREAGPDDEEAAAGPSPGPSQCFYQASEGSARLVCGQDKAGTRCELERFVFPGVDDEEVELDRKLLSRSRDNDCLLIIVRDDVAHDPFRVLRTFLRVFHPSVPYGCCRRLRFPEYIRICQDPTCGVVSDFLMQCEGR